MYGHYHVTITCFRGPKLVAWWTGINSRKARQTPLFSNKKIEKNREETKKAEEVRKREDLSEVTE